MRPSSKPPESIVEKPQVIPLIRWAPIEDGRLVRLIYVDEAGVTSVNVV